MAARHADAQAMRRHHRAAPWSAAFRAEDERRRALHDKIRRERQASPEAVQAIMLS